jgi:hypothetical protein
MKRAMRDGARVTMVNEFERRAGISQETAGETGERDEGEEDQDAEAVGQNGTEKGGASFWSGLGEHEGGGRQSRHCC